MGFIDSIFGNKKQKIKDYLNRNAVIIDVREEEELKQGAIAEAKNIPLNQLADHVKELKELEPLIVCCRSGIRSAKATEFLNLNNIDAINGGSWKTVKAYL